MGRLGAGGDKGFEVLGGSAVVGIEGSRFWGGWGLARTTRTEGSRFCRDDGLMGLRVRGLEAIALVETKSSRFRGGSGLVGTEGSKFWCLRGLGFEVFAGFGGRGQPYQRLTKSIRAL